MSWVAFKRCFLICDNAFSHTDACTVGTIGDLNFEVLYHPLCHHDLALSNFPLFGSFMRVFCSWKFTGDKVKEAMQEWFKSEPKTFYSDETMKPTKCNEK
jgi:hypothetical protein